MRYHLVTLGCAKNTFDSERLERLLQADYHQPVERPSQADILIVNTCGFIEAAQEESLRVIKGLAHKKRPGQKLVVAGCLAQIRGHQIQEKVPGIDALFGVEQWQKMTCWLGRASPPLDMPSTTRLPHRPSAYLKISDGCQRPCTFCIIPQIKGPFHSTPQDELLAEARRLAAEGVQELVLVAQDVTAYGEEVGIRDGLPNLLERLVEAVPQVPWIRIMYGYPGGISQRLIETMARLPQICHYLDIPLQHASPAVLRRMRRPHNVQRVEETLAALRQAMPDIALRTTFIVGFPGETEGDFQHLLDFVQEEQFDHVGVFTYSPQPGTPAGEAPDQVAEAVKQDRYRRLMEVQQQISLTRHRQQIGRELDVLVESLPVANGKRYNGNTPICVGRTYRDAPEVDGLVIVAGEAPTGGMVKARITDATPYDLVGQIVEGPGHDS